jgi:hypothetical protein
MTSLVYSSFKFCCSLFSNVINNSGFTVSYGWTTVKKKQEKLSEEVSMAAFKILSRHLPGRTEEMKNLSQDWWCQNSDCTCTPPELSQMYYHLSQLVGTFLF